jgi:hypothetical protein
VFIERRPKEKRGGRSGEAEKEWEGKKRNEMRRGGGCICSSAKKERLSYSYKKYSI